ncbi:hypothetical protein CF645_38185, partial [Burkholderia pseudomallei]
MRDTLAVIGRGESRQSKGQLCVSRRPKSPSRKRASPHTPEGATGRAAGRPNEKPVCRWAYWEAASLSGRFASSQLVVTSTRHSRRIYVPLCDLFPCAPAPTAGCACSRRETMKALRK